MPIKTQTITLQRVYSISPNVKHFVFDPGEMGPLHFKAGQFITMHFTKNDKTLRRSYSLANQPEQPNRIEFAAGYVKHGPASELLFNLKPGDSIQINGPFGRLILRQEPVTRYILVATSTGITPYRSMLNQLAQRLKEQADLEIIIMQGIQTREDLLYGDDFINFTHTNKRTRFSAYYSRETRDDLLEFEHKGYVQTGLEALNLNPSQDIVYLCGNPGMIDESYALLTEKGFDISRVRREKYISN